jgi:fibronectin type III domain protein
MPLEKWGSLVTSEAMGPRRAPRGALVLMSAVSLVALGLGVTSASAVEPKLVVQSRTNSTTSLDVSWTEVKGADGYRIAYSTDNSLKKKVQATAEVQKGTDATITGLDADKTYFVQVTAVDAKGAAVGGSAVVSAKTAYQYPAPGDIYATKVTNKSMTLSWKSVGKTPGYTVETSIKGKPTIATDSTSINLTGLSASTKYSFKVRAGKGTEALSDNSPSQSFTTSGFDLAAPDHLTQAKQGTTFIDLTWDKVAGLANGQGYVVEYDPESGSFTKSKTTKTITGTSTRLKGLATDLTYYARMWVVDAKGKRISNRSDYIVGKTRVPRGTLVGDVSGAPSGDLEAVAYDAKGQAALTVPVSGGHYELDVRPGTYKVQIIYVGTKDDYVSTFAHTSGSGWTISQGKTYKVTEGDNQKVDDVDIKHGNVVKGTVKSGKTLIRDVDVTAISGVDPKNSKAEREVIGMARTDSKGEFEIAGLADGPYWFRYHYVGSGAGYKTLSQHLDVKEDLGLKVTLAKN